MTDADDTTDVRAEHDGSPPGRRFRMILLIVALYAAAVYLPFLGSGRTLTRHEIDMTQPALIALETGEWLIPQYQGRDWIHKPPLGFWMTAPWFALWGGFDEFAARLPAALSAIALCLVVTVLTRRFYGDTAGLFAGLLQATFVYMYMQGRLGEMDIIFALFVTSAHAVLAWHWGRGRTDLPLRSAALFHTLAGFAILAKGPLGVVFLGLTVLSFCAVRKTLRPLGAVLLTPALLCSLVVGFWWYAAVTVKLGGWALERWNYSYVSRFLGQYHMGAEPFYYYFVNVPWLLLPWSIVLLLGARELVRDVRRPDAWLERFLWVWFLAGVGFLSIAVFKHKHYCIPVLPPLTVLCAKLLADHAARLGRRAKPLYITIFAVALIALNVVGGVIMPRRDPRRARVEFVREVVPQVAADATLYIAGLGQDSVAPYVEHRYRQVDSWIKFDELEAQQPGKTMWVLTRRGYLPTAAERGMQFEELASEPVREGYPLPETLVLARVTVPPPARDDGHKPVSVTAPATAP